LKTPYLKPDKPTAILQPTGDGESATSGSHELQISSGALKKIAAGSETDPAALVCLSL
jgi:hypothetical protein